MQLCALDVNFIGDDMSVRAVRYCDIYRVMTETRLSFCIKLYHLFRCTANHTAVIFASFGQRFVFFHEGNTNKHGGE